MRGGKPWLLLAGWGSVAAGLAHLACIAGGPDWYRFFGAGERMARAVEQGRLTPHLMTAAIATILFVWAAYAFSAAGTGPRLPLLRLALLAITAVLLARAAAIFLPAASFWLPEHSETFRIVSSLIVLALGLSFLAGTVKAWPALSTRS